MDLKKPKIYGDRLMKILAKVNHELNEQEIDFVMDEALSYQEDDVQNYARIRRSIIEIHDDLQNDNIRGDTGMERLQNEVFELFEDLTYRIVESKKFPEFNELYYFMHEHY